MAEKNNIKEIEKLRRENEEYKKLIEEMSEGFAYLEEDLTFSFSNPACDSVFGVTEGKLMGRKLTDFLSPESLKEAKKNIITKEKGKKSVFEIEVNAGDGERRYLLTRSNPRFDDKGRFAGSFVFFYNITKRVKLEEELIFERGLLNSLLNTIPDHIYFKDEKSRFIKVSKSLADWFNVKSVDGLMGKTDFDFFTEEHARPAFEDEQKIMKTGNAIEGKVEKETHPDGRVTWVSTTKVPRYDKKGNVIGITGISRDITEKKLWEEEREKKLEAQREELIELSTPVIDVWEGVLTVPILGSLDSERASRISESLLTQIVEERADVAIIDISGISAVDSAVADRLIRTAKAVRLVGAMAILTGVGVEIAQTIADLGIDMGGLKTMATLKDGLRYVISRNNVKEKED
ncbi:PAS domain S-box protein [candidate division WOR-3 bacterium]|nr:PAS domain S-box protein [candidate division WOR-3 bacterium]